ncbi:hypothetical protein [Nonomuraea sp. CA-141351]|uniref:hypothetical protein n=1 Tax=Nonomuraea sp. CA-141351 TaxID=3239996 RepID=UPI003D8C8686
MSPSPVISDFRVAVWDLTHRLRKSRFWVVPPWRRILAPLLTQRILSPYRVGHARWGQDSAVLVLLAWGAPLRV